MSRRLPTGLLALLASLIVTVAPVGAHANLLAASPAPGQPAGGAIERVQLVFDEPITELVTTFEGPDDATIEHSVEAISPQQYELQFDELEVEGQYRVRYEFLSLDTDRVELNHGFEFDRSAPAVLPFSGPVLIDQEGALWWQWPLVGALALVVVGLADRLRRQRRQLQSLV